MEGVGEGARWSGGGRIVVDSTPPLDTLPKTSWNVTSGPVVVVVVVVVQLNLKSFPRCVVTVMMTKWLLLWHCTVFLNYRNQEGDDG